MNDHHHRYAQISIIAVLCAGVLIATLSLLFTDTQKTTTPSEILYPVSAYAPELLGILDRKKATVQAVLSEPAVVTELNRMNRVHAALSRQQIEKNEALWLSKPVRDAYVEHLSGVITERLKTLQAKDNGVAEIFITSIAGLNVAQSNPTSDYIQSDERWWQEVYADGAGATFYGQVEFDESANRIGIPLYIALYEPGSEKLIGIAKVIVDSADIVNNL